jgi:hypothetical protein
MSKHLEGSMYEAGVKLQNALQNLVNSLQKQSIPIPPEATLALQLGSKHFLN